MTAVGERLSAGAISDLDAAAIRAALSPVALQCLERLDVLVETASTNRCLLEQAPPSQGRLAVCMADHQTSGRGRGGRVWQMPPGGGLCFSAGWRFARRPKDMAALPLAAGVVARRALRRAAGLGVAIKWPNDLLWQGAKLGGILVELAGPAASPYAVVGIGINVAVPADRLANVSDWPGGAVDLVTATGGRAPSRNRLAAALIDELTTLFSTFARTGLAGVRTELDEADWLRGRPVVVGQGTARGVAAGIDADGALLVRQADGALQRVLTADISVRPDPAAPLSRSA